MGQEGLSSAGAGPAVGGPDTGAGKVCVGTGAGAELQQETAGHVPKEGDKVYCRDQVSALSSG